jgi:hypothetical protein
MLKSRAVELGTLLLNRQLYHPCQRMQSSHVPQQDCVYRPVTSNGA